MPHNPFEIHEPDFTLQEIGLETRLATAAERPSFYTDERLGQLLHGEPAPPDPIDVSVETNRISSNFSTREIANTFAVLGPATCRFYPELSSCLSAPAAAGEARVRRPLAVETAPGVFVQQRADLPTPAPRPPQAVDAFDSLRSRLAAEALLRERDAADSQARDRATDLERLGRATQAQSLRTQEEAFFALTPLERQRAGVTLRPGGGVQPAPTLRFR